MFSFIGDILAAILSFLLPRMFKPRSAAQQAVDTESKEAQAVTDSPSQQQAINDLRGGNV